MNYAIEILEKDRELLLKAIDLWTDASRQEYKSAFAEREKRLHEVEKAIAILKSHA